MARKRADVTTEALAADYAAGMTLRQLSERYGLTFQAIAGRLTRAGVARRPKYYSNGLPRPLHACETCGRSFKTRYDAQRYCSQACVPRKGRQMKTYCKRGHVLAGENLSPRYGAAPPRCRVCQSEQQRRYDAKRRGRNQETPDAR